jgi:hypothetical protein
VIPLDSSRWSELLDAYGAATDIPRLLRELPQAAVGDDYQTEPWHSIWSALCHQGDVYPASFAAVPHVVAAAEGRAVADRLQYLLVVGCVESYRHRPRAPAMPEDLGAAYDVAVKRAAALVVDALQQEWPEASYRALLGSLAALQGHAALGAAIMDLEPELICSECEAVVAVSGYDMF